MFNCTCCGEPALKQCDDHDTGYGVCDSCLAKHGRENFCHVNCRAHGPVTDIRHDFIVTMDDLVERLDAIQTREHLAQGFTNHPADKVTWSSKGRKFAYIDIGGSGAWLVEKTTGEIFNIKSYGTPDYNKKAKSDIGNIYTVGVEKMHRMRWNYLK